MDRRRFLAISTTAISYGLAGCSSSADTEEETTQPPVEETPAPTSNPTDTTTPTPEPTPTPTPKPPSHEIGDTFVVGDGAKKLQHRISSKFTREKVGDEIGSSTADGVFLGVIDNVKNLGDETVSIDSDEMYHLVDSKERTYKVDDDAVVYATESDAQGEETLIFEELNPGLSLSGAIFFDVSPGNYRLRVDPAGVISLADDHYVELGSV
jgi:hypothetical protein